MFAGLLIVMVYTHNWALFFTAGALVAFALILKMSSDRRALLKDGALAFGAVGIAYLPWVPTLISQAQHTGAPWSNAPGFGALLEGFLIVERQGVVVGGVGDRARTGDIQLGRLTLYQLSYTRVLGS